MPTFCRGWGALPFDRSTPEITAHALLSWWLWRDKVDEKVCRRIASATPRARAYLRSRQRADGAWIPLWFGNEHARDDENPVYGTAQVVACLRGCEALARQTGTLIETGAQFLVRAQRADGSWGGDADLPSSLEETGLALLAIGRTSNEAVARGVRRLIEATRNGTVFSPAPIGLYFAKLWYHEKTYPVIWTLAALQAAKTAPELATP